MKQIITLLLILCCCTTLSAQKLEVKQSPSAARALEQIKAIKHPQNVNGYRIGIFFDNGQQARQKANEAKVLFKANFPSQPVYMVYESPYYKVSAGNCLTEEEAIMLFEKIKMIFPNAYVMRETIKITDFIEYEIEPLTAADSLLLK